MKKIVAVLLLAALPASANAMNVAQFLVKAEGLKKKGMMALLSSDLGVLKKEFKSAGTALKAENEAARKAGRKPQFCAPEKAKLNSEELLAHFHSIPPAQRGMSFKTGLGLFMEKKFPCR